MTTPQPRPLAYSVMTGNPVEGLELYGLFTTAEEASEAASQDAHMPPD